MKKHLITFLACLAFATLPFAITNASIAVTPQKMRAAMMEKMRAHPERVIKNDSKTTKRLHRVAKRLERKALKNGAEIDFNDPVDKWLWFGIFGLGIAIVLSIFTGLGIAGLVAFLAVVCLVVWVIKRGAI